MLAATGEGGTSVVWDVATGKELHRFPKQGKWVVLAFLPDSKTLASASGDGLTAECTVQLSDLASGKELRRWVSPQRILETLAVSPDGRLLAVGGQEEGLRVWETTTGKERPEFRRSLKEGVSSAAFSPDGRTLALGLEGGLISLLETVTGKERRRFKGSQSLSLFSVAFAPDGRTLASGGGDGTVLIWDRSGQGERSAVPGQRPLSSEWEGLRNANAVLADQAIWAMVTAPKLRSVSYLRDRLRPVAKIDIKEVEQLVADLDSDNFVLRDRATRELEHLGELATPALRKALERRPTPEVRRRLLALLETLEGPVSSAEQLRPLRAVEVLEHIGNAEARQVLEQLARGAPEARLTQEARASLQRLSKRQPLAP
jgi:hypothetical protein